MSWPADAWPRHLLVDLAPDAALAGVPDDLADRVAAWRAAVWPLIVRRPGRQGDLLALGLPLPPAWGGHRLALSAPLAGIRRRGPPPALADLADPALAPWQAALAGLDARVVGSRAWGHLTGLAWARPDSDLDLVILVPNRAAWDRTTAALATALAADPVPTGDIELILPGDRAVAWGEVRRARPGDTVLVKTTAQATLAPLGDLLASLG